MYASHNCNLDKRWEHLKKFQIQPIHFSLFFFLCLSSLSLQCWSILVTRLRPFPVSGNKNYLSAVFMELVEIY